MNTWIKGLLAVLMALFMGMALAFFFVLRALQPQPGEWAHTVQLGPWQRELSMPALLRIGSHPFVLRLLEGRTLNTPFGAVQWQAMAAPNTWRAVCAPCTLPMEGVGRDTLQVSRLELTVVPDIEMNLQGSFSLGEAPHALHGRWSSRIERAQWVLNLQVVDEPVLRAFALFRHALPELTRVQIEGRLNLKAQLRWPSRAWSLQPRVDGLRVAGLGTEVLLHAQPACGEGGDVGPWLPRAVIAAEDQRFDEHAGYDLNEIVSAWSANRRSGDALQGASTLSQQLAKLLYTGDQRDPVRKLRELLYAVELDRTLGKARLLHLYLAVAPWGDGQCGAQAAARRYFRKPAAQLTPIEAVWLASLLHNPDRELTALARGGEPHRARLVWVAGQLRPISRAERAALVHTATRWSPPRATLKVAMAVAASQAAQGR